MDEDSESSFGHRFRYKGEGDLRVDENGLECNFFKDKNVLWRIIVDATRFEVSCYLQEAVYGLGVNDDLFWVSKRRGCWERFFVVLEMELNDRINDHIQPLPKLTAHCMPNLSHQEGF